MQWYRGIRGITGIEVSLVYRGITGIEVSLHGIEVAEVSQV